ncbi:MAG: flagellar protein FlgN [Synergistaceae bacterium]|jgi:hypothetical protein|nr:flagellar protein FlgN [Synergistaceae bacterium]
MPESSERLADILLKQDEILSELLVVVVRQRDALKEGRIADLQDLMSELRRLAVRAQAIETKRVHASDGMARELMCEPVVSEIIKALPSEAASMLEGPAKKLTGTVNGLKMEMSIVSRLMEEATALNNMLLAEWRRLGQRSLGFASGTFDTKI